MLEAERYAFEKYGIVNPENEYWMVYDKTLDRAVPVNTKELVDSVYARIEEWEQQRLKNLAVKLGKTSMVKVR